MRLEHLWVHHVKSEGNNKLCFQKRETKSMESPRNKTEMMKGPGEEEVGKGDREGLRTQTSCGMAPAEADCARQGELADDNTNDDGAITIHSSLEEEPQTG